MDIPKIINKDNKEYILEKQVNDNMYLYKEMLHGYKECFTNYDLGITKPIRRKKGGMYGWSE